MTNYPQVFFYRTSVLDQVYHCIMPMAGSPQLTATERADLLNWLICGAPNN